MMKWAMSAMSEPNTLPDMKNKEEIKEYAENLFTTEALKQVGTMLFCALDTNHKCLNSIEKIPTMKAILKFLSRLLYPMRKGLPMAAGRIRKSAKMLPRIR